MERTWSVHARSGRLAIRLAAVVAIGFYALTAHLTRGHEADFGKQWLAARLIASGHGRQLFDLGVQRAELERQFDVDTIDRGIWRDGIGGPTYPPLLAILFAPLGWLPPRWAAWALIELSIAAVVVTARLIQRLSENRIPWEITVLAILTMPSFFLAIGLGQNSALSLLIFVAGWSLIAQGNYISAGIVWGLFAYKPTWGLATAWIPAVIGKPRIYLGMFATTAALVAISLPICGVQSWFDWLGVAQQTELYYQSIARWTELSRDLPGLLRRLEPGIPMELAGWVMVCAVAGATGWTWHKRVRGNSTVRFGDPATTALLAGAILSCPRFMFYDMTLAVVPVLSAISGLPAMGRGARGVLGACVGLLWIGTAYEYAHSSMLGPPLDTFALIGLWALAIGRSHGETSEPAEFLTGSTQFAEISSPS